MLRGNRKSTPKVVDGTVRKKNKWTQSPDYFWAPTPRMVQVDRQRPGDGYKHVLSKNDVYRFLELLPDWNCLAVGLNAIVLSPGGHDMAGCYYHLGVIEVCAWETGHWIECNEGFYNDHREVFERLGVPCEAMDDGYYLCKFDEASIRDYQLLHILLHELGHHHDRMTSRRQKKIGRGEEYAEDYALRYEARIWDAYHREFRR
ncbi:hypothetical protein CCAX7_007490 [Capsulimonas corticalis]|uniref:Uncharacterized protein n=1 Tax=Capsulimonas corticalis TaxID=2219043 RepID=A0A402D1T9_9BACT|nr:hypothetical protein [Capsulimonas corticalis]BDI28698.1 hypothetical protein CCAX7_007490 [Capsulimonas corticalis]